MKIGTRVTVTIEKLVFGGQALGRVNDKVIFVWNALPGETVEVEIIKKKKRYIEGVAVNIVQASPHRIAAEEEHFLSCSPWQIMTYDQEIEWKRKTVQEVYRSIGHFEVDDAVEVVSFPDDQYGYRNKMEYSFAETDAGELSLAFFMRGRHRREAIPCCSLATSALNETAHAIVDWLNEHRFPIRSAKSLVVRSNNKGETIAALFVKDRISVLKAPPLTETMRGFAIYFSDPRCPAARPDDVLYQEGNQYLDDCINGKTLRYGLLSFFQINQPLFQAVLDDIRPFLSSEKRLIDFYSGVGAISIPLADACKECVLVELNEEAVAFAHENVANNNLAHYSVELLSTEKALHYIEPDSYIIFDPPRSGLHPKMVERTLRERPERIIYLSCNASTQARDVGLLLEAYDLTFTKLYNFFPRTPHVEALCILERKSSVG